MGHEQIISRKSLNLIRAYKKPGGIRAKRNSIFQTVEYLTIA